MEFDLSKFRLADRHEEFADWCAERESKIPLEEPPYKFNGRCGSYLLLERKPDYPEDQGGQ